MKPKLQIIRPTSILSAESFGATKVWLTYSFAPEWFKDALNEARKGSDHNSRRREILFAVCCVESYLFEWTRDEVLNSDFDPRDQLERYFQKADRRGVCHRWKEVINNLKKDNQISNAPDFGLPYWQDFRKLVGYRDGLVHGKSSRPEISSSRDARNPIPSKNELDKLSAGWATEVVIKLIKCLHEAVGTLTPQWLVEP